MDKSMVASGDAEALQATSVVDGDGTFGPFLVVVIGEGGHGKSTIVNAIRDTTGPEAEVGVAPQGMTKETRAYHGNRKLRPAHWLVVDTTGIGAAHSPLVRQLADLEAVLAGEKYGPVHGVLFACPVDSPRLRVGTRVAQVLLALGRAHTDRVILVGTKADKAEPGGEEFFRQRFVPVFFEAAKGGMRCRVVGRHGHNDLEAGIRELPAGFLGFRRPDAQQLSERLAVLLGADPVDLQAQIEAARGRQQTLPKINAAGEAPAVGKAPQCITKDVRPPMRSCNTPYSQIVQVNRELQKPEDQRLDEIILKGLDGQALGNLGPAPQAICRIGLIMCVSLNRDFPLVEKGQFAKEIRNPGSFRATLVQVAGEAHDAFMTAHGSMQQLGLLMGTVPDHMKAAVAYLMNKEGFSTRQLADHMGRELEAVTDVGDKCLKLAQGTHDKFEHVGFVLQIVMELLVVKQSGDQTVLEKTRQERKLGEKKKETVQQRITKSEHEFNKLDQTLKQAQETMIKVMNARPSTGDLIGAAFADAGCALIKNLSSLGMGMVAGAGMPLAAVALAGGARARSGPRAAGGASTIDVAAAANAAVGGAVDFMMKHVEGLSLVMAQQVANVADRQKVVQQLQHVQEHVAQLTAQAEMHTAGALSADLAGLGRQLEEALAKGVQALHDGTDATRSNVLAETQELRKQAQALVVKKAHMLSTSALPPAQPFGNPGSGGTDSPSVAAGMVDSWKFAMENARAVLSDTEKRRDRELQELRALEDRMIVENEKLARLNFQELTLDEILKILQEAIRHIGECQIAWSRLIELFIFIRNLTNFCCEKQVPAFVKLSQGCLTDIEHGDKIVGCLKDQLYQMVVKASQTAYSAQHLAMLYHQLSEAHFLPALAGLASIFALDANSTQVTAKKKELMLQCSAASQAIAAKVEQQRRLTTEQIRGRMAAIKHKMGRILGEPEPELKMLVQSAAKQAKENPAYAAPRVVPVGLDVDDLI